MEAILKMEHLLTPTAEETIVQMLYHEIREKLLSLYGVEGQYSVSHLRMSLTQSRDRDLVRPWLKNASPNWLYKNRNKEDFKEWGKLWALRKELRRIQHIPHYKELLGEWESYNIHYVFHDCTYVPCNGIKTYKPDRDDDITYFRLSH